MTLRVDKEQKGCWYLYIIKCRDGTFYTGITNHLDRRLDQHNRGTASRYTRSRLPVTLLYRERCRTKSSALKKECAIKSLSRPEKDKYIQSRGILKTRRLKRGAAKS